MPHEVKVFHVILQQAVTEAAAIQDPAERGVLRTLARYQAKFGDIPGAFQSLAMVPKTLPDAQDTFFALEEIAVEPMCYAPLDPLLASPIHRREGQILTS